MDPNIIEKFTTHLKSVLVRAYTLAHELGERSITLDHLLWSILTERGSIGAELLQKAQVSHERLRETIARRTARGEALKKEADPPIPTLAAATKRAIEKAVLTANTYDHKYVGTEHLLSGILEIEDDALSETLDEERVNVRSLKSQITIVLKSTSKFPDLAETETKSAPAPARAVPGEDEPADEGADAPETMDRKRPKRTGSKTPALDFFTTDLTGPEAQKRIDAVIGREREIERMIQILCRRTKNNPILLGDPGVGKTAIVEGLARKIAEGAVPPALAGKKLLSLDLALVVAGTVYRGEFEGRVKQIIDEIRARPDVILFIDEVHNVTGTGSASGSMDAANILKPALARGEIRCIGATTLTEYKKFIEADPALDRRFQPVSVAEPTAAETEKILTGIKGAYETFHRVTVTAEAVSAAVRLADRYLQDRCFPDKAIDLIDEAAAAARVAARAPEPTDRRATIEAELARVRTKKQQAVRGERYAQATAMKDREQALEAELATLVTMTDTGEASPVATIGRREVALVVAKITGVPESTILAEETAEFADLETRLAARVVGQDAVLHGVADHLRRARAGLTAPKRPLASFLFLGPSGVGKTSLATALADEVFHDPKALIRLDMSEFGESFTVSKILGAPAGYVGYRDQTKLTDLVKRRPHAVVLFDEVEKAHPDVLNILLQILEDGQITEATGRAVHFTQTVVVLTSNVGGARLQKGGLGFASGGVAADELSADVRRDAEAHFRPELLNRLDKIFVFKQLEPPDFEAIVRRDIAALAARVLERGVKLKVTERAVSVIAKETGASRAGARAVRRLLEERVETPLAERLLAGELAGTTTFVVDAQKGKLAYTVR